MTEQKRGLFDSIYTRWESGWNRSADEAVAAANQARARAYDGDTAITDALTRFQESRQRLADVPEQFRRQREIAFAKHAEEIEAIGRATALNRARHVRNMTTEALELTKVQTELVHARTARLDALQQYAAQEKYGEQTYELVAVIRALERLELTLSEQERRALFDRRFTGLLAPPSDAPPLPAPSGPHDAEIDKALLMRREQLEADGMPTDAIDAVIADRMKK